MDSTSCVAHLGDGSSQHPLGVCCCPIRNLANGSQAWFECKLQDLESPTVAQRQQRHVSRGSIFTWRVTDQASAYVTGRPAGSILYRFLLALQESMDSWEGLHLHILLSRHHFGQDYYNRLSSFDWNLTALLQSLQCGYSNFGLPGSRIVGAPPICDCHLLCCL